MTSSHKTWYKLCHIGGLSKFLLKTESVVSSETLGSSYQTTRILGDSQRDFPHLKFWVGVSGAVQGGGCWLYRNRATGSSAATDGMKTAGISSSVRWASAIRLSNSNSPFSMQSCVCPSISFPPCTVSCRQTINPKSSSYFSISWNANIDLVDARNVEVKGTEQSLSYEV
jgi:hypothetical protein